MKILPGSLLDLTEGIILHQVNTKGAIGGLAGALRRKWPAAFAAYYTACANEDALGRFVTGVATVSNPPLQIGHVFGQLHPGPNTDMRAVRSGLEMAAKVITGPVYAPYKMGCGLGGGDWDEYLAALVKAFPEIIIIQRPEDTP